MEAFAMYLLTGAACLVVGSGLTNLMEHFNAELVAVTALGSAFALGRVATVTITGWVTEKLGPKITLGAGLLLLLAFLGGITVVNSIPAAMVCAALGGVGMGTQDAACPEILTRVFPKHYPSALSAGQAFFGAGCFLPPLVMSFVLRAGRPFYYTYYVFAALCLLMLAVLPLMKLEREQAAGSAAGEAAAQNAPAAPPPKTKRPFTVWLLFGVMCVFYCACTNTINMYTASYAMAKGMAESQAVNVLTMYNVGSMVGSFAFAAVVRWVKPITLLCANLAGAAVFLVVALFTDGFWPMAMVYFFAGALLGVLFSLEVTVAVGISSGSAGRAGAIVAMLTGGADFLTPLVTGAVITVAGIGANVWFAIAFAVVSLAASLVFRRREKAVSKSFQ